jgi:transcriptional regulator with XRE-family HTH domain
MQRRQTRFARQGTRRGAFLVARFGSELRLARTAAGLSQRRLAELADITQPFVSLVETGRRRADWSTACAMAAAAGHELSIRLFPVRSPTLRDSGQLAAVQRLVIEAHASWHPRIEAPVAAGDPRAADLLLVGSSEVLHIEVERTLVDFQAQLRAAQRKRSTLTEIWDQPIRLVLAVPGTKRMRALLASAQPVISTALPARSAAVWRSIRTGAPLGGDGLLYLPAGVITRGN